jgi:hypothetical protein
VRQAEEQLNGGPARQDHSFVFCAAIGTPLDPRNLNRSCRRKIRSSPSDATTLVKAVQTLIVAG